MSSPNGSEKRSNFGKKIAVKATLGLIVTVVGGIAVAYFIKDAIFEPIPTPSKIPLPTIIIPTLTPTSLPPSETPLAKISCPEENRIHKIDFNYNDDPTQHFWDPPFGDGRPIFTPISDERFDGNVLQITSDDVYGMDYQVGYFVSSIEFAAKFQKNAHVYTYFRLRPINGSKTQDVYFFFQRGTTPSSKKADEWTVPINAKAIGGDWLQFKIDMQDVINRTEGSQGSQWIIDQLLHLRLRGNLTIAYICLY